MAGCEGIGGRLMVAISYRLDPHAFYSCSVFARERCLISLQLAPE